MSVHGTDNQNHRRSGDHHPAELVIHGPGGRLGIVLTGDPHPGWLREFCHAAALVVERDYDDVCLAVLDAIEEAA